MALFWCFLLKVEREWRLLGIAMREVAGGICGGWWWDNYSRRSCLKKPFFVLVHIAAFLSSHSGNQLSSASSYVQLVF